MLQHACVLDTCWLRLQSPQQQPWQALLILQALGLHTAQCWLRMHLPQLQQQWQPRLLLQDSCLLHIWQRCVRLQRQQQLPCQPTLCVLDCVAARCLGCLCLLLVMAQQLPWKLWALVRGLEQGTSEGWAHMQPMQRPTQQLQQP